MSRMTAWLVATVALMVFLVGYQVTVAGVGGNNDDRPPAPVGSSAPAGAAPATPESHPPK